MNFRNLRPVLAAAVLLLPFNLYAQTKVSQLPVASALTGAESIPAVQVGSCLATGGTCQTTPAQIATYVEKQLPVFVPAALTTAGIQAAMAAAGSAGGGVVPLPAGTISLSASLTAVQGVYLIGVAPQVNTTNSIPDNPSATFTGGTVFTCAGSFPAITYSTTALGTPASQGAFTATGLFNAGFKNFGVLGCTYGIQAGATNAASFWYSEFENLYFSGQTVWGMWLTNYQHCNFRRIYTFGALNGQFHGNDVPGGILDPGNSTYYDLYNVIPSGSGNWISRGIVFTASNTTAGQNNNQFKMDRIQSNRFGAVPITQAATMVAPIATVITNTSASIAATNSFAANDPVSFSATTGTAGGQVLINTTYYVSATGLSGSTFQVSATVGGGVITFNASGTPNVLVANFTVTDGTKFALQLPVTFTTTVDGFTASKIYFVVAIAGNKIQVANQQGGLTPVYATAATAININHNGFPAFEFSAMPGSSLTAAVITNLDVESGGTCAALFQNANGLNIQMSQVPGAGQATQSICGRGVANAIFTAPQSIDTDFDNGSVGGAIQVYGAKLGASVGYQGAGIWYDSVSGKSVMSLGSPNDSQSAGLLTYDPSTNTGIVLPKNAGIGQLPKVVSSASFAVSALNVVICNQTSAAANTLPTVTANNAGAWVEFVNHSGAAQTIATDGTQLFNGIAGRTVITLNNGATVRLSAVSTGGFTWDVIGGSSAMVAGVISAPT